MKSHNSHRRHKIYESLCTKNIAITFTKAKIIREERGKREKPMKKRRYCHSSLSPKHIKWIKEIGKNIEDLYNSTNRIL